MSNVKTFFENQRTSITLSRRCLVCKGVLVASLVWEISFKLPFGPFRSKLRRAPVFPFLSAYLRVPSFIHPLFFPLAISMSESCRSGDDYDDYDVALIKGNEVTSV